MGTPAMNNPHIRWHGSRRWTGAMRGEVMPNAQWSRSAPSISMLLFLWTGCRPDSPPPTQEICSAREIPLDGGCEPVGVTRSLQCPVGGSVADDGTCRPAGVPPEACAPGFEADGSGGCAVILPPD